jgi:hypothetical protein
MMGKGRLIEQNEGSIQTVVLNHFETWGHIHRLLLSHGERGNKYGQLIETPWQLQKFLERTNPPTSLMLFNNAIIGLILNLLVKNE